MNDDGYDDVIIGAPSPYAYARWFGGSPEDSGRAFIYLGSATGLASSPASVIEGTMPDDWLGLGVGTAGDVNGDGYADVMVGAPHHDTDVYSPGRVQVFYGSASGIDETQADWIYDYPWQWTLLGWSVSTAGDVNGDGYDDVIIGTDWVDAVLVFHGSANGLSSEPDWSSEGDPDPDNWEVFGYSVSMAGDVNGDGYDDVIVGAPGYTNGQEEEGRIYLYYGSADGLSFNEADWTFESNVAGAALGYSVAAAGDVNNDGYDDFLVGLPYYSNGQNEEGAVYLFYGRLGVPGSSPDWSFESDLESALLGWAVGPAGNVNGDAYDDILIGYPELWVDAGGVYLFYGAADDSHLPIADFSASPLSGAAPLTVTFTNLSQGATSYFWQFGDSITSTQSAPTHVYTQAGVYPVTLTVNGPQGTDELVRFDYVIVTGDGRATTGLQTLYTFQEGSGATVNDVAGVGVALNLTIGDTDAVTWLAEGGLSIDSSVLIASTSAATKVIDAAQTANELTIEAWVEPVNTTQDGAARIVTLSEDYYSRNFTLGQEADQYELRLRTSATDEDGDPYLYTPSDSVSTDLTHLVVTYDDRGLRQIFINNVRVASDGIPGDFSTWDDTYI